MRPFAFLRHPLLLGVATAYALLQLARHGLRWRLPAAITSYLADLLWMPLLLSAALLAHRLLISRRAALPGGWLLAAWAGVSVWFEVLLPRHAPRAVADLADVLAYALGTLAFHHWLNRPAT